MGIRPGLGRCALSRGDGATHELRKRGQWTDTRWAVIEDLAQPSEQDVGSVYTVCAGVSDYGRGVAP